ncbi:glutamate formimidoyltransferase [Candidatus Neomarinimicrobiota bacterium]
MPLIECVPNFSEGRDQSVIGAISEAVSSIQGVELLHVDSDTDVNRTVMTFVGEKHPLGEAAFKAISKAVELIDMRKHNGKHPRIGAADVCPFIPFTEVDMGVATELARQVGERVGSNLDIPVFLYGEAAKHPDRYRLAQVRRGEYEGIPKKLKDSAWNPDFGPSEFRPKSGACCVGSRNILIAFNICLNTTDQQIAREIASTIRESEANQHGSTKQRPGSLRACRAIGWYLPTYKCTQVSMNLEDYTITPPHVALEEVRAQAEKRGFKVIGSEIIGMVPLQAMLMAGRYYAKKVSISEAEQIEIAVKEMGLSSVKPFNPRERIIEYRLFADSRS